MSAIKAADLIGPALDWAVTYANRDAGHRDFIKKLPIFGTQPIYSMDWSAAGPLIEREGITIIRCNDDYGVDDRGFCNNVRIAVWCATTGQHGSTSSTEHQDHDEMYQIDCASVTYGPTPLVAAMRCYVASQLGATVEIPDELLREKEGDQ